MFLFLNSTVNCVTEKKTASHKAASVLTRNMFWFVRYISLWCLSEGGHRPGQAGLPSQDDGRGQEAERLLPPTHMLLAADLHRETHQSQKRSELWCEWFMLGKQRAGTCSTEFLTMILVCDSEQAQSSATPDGNESGAKQAVMVFLSYKSSYFQTTTYTKNPTY